MAAAPKRPPVDSAEVEALFRSHYEELLRYLSRITGDPDRAADAAQEAFRRMLRSPPRHENPRGWLYRVATNIVREKARTRARRRQLLEEQPWSVTPPAPRTPEDELARRRRADAVRSALEELRERDRAILLMREEGFTHREIAEAVGTTTASVGTLVARALDRLARALESPRTSPDTPPNGRNDE